jgi:protein-tyrosine phosphatase
VIFMADTIASIHWEAVGTGRLTLRGRPGKKLMQQLAAAGCTRVVTLLAEREGGADIGDALRPTGIAWTWLPLPNASTPTDETEKMLLDALPRLSAALDGGESILIHCSAGIHRTGMVAYALLRWRGMDAPSAHALMERLRAVTAMGMYDQHYAWGDGIAASISADNGNAGGEDGASSPPAPAED